MTWPFSLSTTLCEVLMRSRFRSPTQSTARTVARVLTVLAASALTGCAMLAQPPKDLDYSRTRTSEAGHYRATIHPQGDTIPQGRLHKWTLHLETATGAPVDSATLAVDGGMPQH